MNKLMLIVAPLLLLLVGCTSAPEEKTSLEIVEVDIQFPESVDEAEEVAIKTFVTQGEEKVEDAQEVQIEIWNVEEGKENSVLVDAEHVGDGVYEVKHSFEAKGVYRVQSHVTARDLHVMPTKQLVVGDLSQEEIDAIVESVEENENHEDVDHGDHGHHH
ncbi:FixH family protein [Sutcliffiella horikoshii]|uniref:FixH family protein n=1 Tax=Sutcliffiella horikoshii TaxID=79883 RepID=UPI0020412980|nr:FixH family protein [Sutcliffiella horikoshii]MCM3619898.1 FixH family protein [Sutcliffiella horikoshii]